MHDNEAGNEESIAERATRKQFAADTWHVNKNRTDGVVPLTKKSLTSPSVEGFLAQVEKTPKPTGTAAGRLIFALDATASREPTWDSACHLQAEMFDATSGLGGLSVQLCYYRGFGEFHASRWAQDSSTLLEQMSAVTCRGGHTQIEKVLQHALSENKAHRVAALVFVGDCME